jgi:BirA family transcriptional regulator, biotin operon repressor / biotin---[acetyl-CoA-carboxylase] ligase
MKIEEQEHFERKIDEWTFHYYPEVISTNDLSRNLPEWNVIRADLQTGGRGRHGREWNSGLGGLWMSMVIPAPAPRERWEILPLVPGWVGIEGLKMVGISKARLRWPNDIMVGEKKLCGILVERFNDETAVIGVGLNVTNQPGVSDSSLVGLTTRLLDHLKDIPELDDLAMMIFRRVRMMQENITEGSWELYRKKINAAWEQNRRVECHLHESIEKGFFIGVDPKGYLILRKDDGILFTYSASQVSLMREI